MDKKEVEEKVKEILAKELNIKKENITPERRLIEDLGMDSFKAIEIIFEIEDSFGKRIKDSEIKNIKTVRDIIQRLEDS